MHNLNYDLIKQSVDDGNLNCKLIQQGEGEGECWHIEFPLKKHNKLTISRKLMLVVAHYLIIPKTISDDGKNVYQYIIIAKEVPGTGQSREFTFRFDAEHKPTINSGKLALEDAQQLSAYGLPVMAPILTLLGKKLKKSDTPQEAPKKFEIPKEEPLLQLPPKPRIKPISISELTFHHDSMHFDFSNDNNNMPAQSFKIQEDDNFFLTNNNNNSVMQNNDDAELQQAIARSLEESHSPQIELIDSQVIKHSDNTEDKELRQAIILSMTTKSMVTDLFQTAWQDYQRHLANSNNLPSKTTQKPKTQHNHSL